MIMCIIQGLIVVDNAVGGGGEYKVLSFVGRDWKLGGSDVG